MFVNNLLCFYEKRQIFFRALEMWLRLKNLKEMEFLFNLLYLVFNHLFLSDEKISIKARVRHIIKFWCTVRFKR